MKKILVSGCCNCPYLILWNDGEGNGMDSIKSGECRHPSFNSQLPNPQFLSPVIFKYDSEIFPLQVESVKANATPTWCPLPENE